MTIKKIIQTRWKITSDQIIIYPYGAIYIMCVIVSVASIVLMLLIINALNDSFLKLISVLWPVELFYLLMIIFFGLFGRTVIIFDRAQGIMYKILFGFLKTTTLPFSDISGIILERNYRGTFRYAVISKEPKWWDTSTGISSAVVNENSKHAKDFQEHVLSSIENFLQEKPRPGSFHYKKK